MKINGIVYLKYSIFMGILCFLVSITYLQIPPQQRVWTDDFDGSNVLSLFNFRSQVETLSTQAAVGVLEPLWNITHGGPRTDEGWGVAVDDNHDVYFTGLDRMSGATADVFLCKFAPEGVELWNTTWGGLFDDEAFVVTTQNRYVYVGGRTFTSFSLNSANMLVLKFYASNGSLVWSRTWDGGNGYDEVDGLAVDGDNLYVAGWTTGVSTQTDIAVLKYDVNGTFLWSRSWGTKGVDEANGQIGVDEKFIYVVGHYNALPLGLGGDAVLVAFNKTDGSYVWNTTWGGSGLDDAFGMTMGSQYIYSVGITNSFGGDMIFLLKYDKNGSLIWNATWGGAGSELTRSVGVSKDEKTIYVVGSTTSFGNGSFDVLLLKYNQDRSLMWSKTWGGPGLDQSHGMALDEPFIYISGETNSYGAGNEDALLLKVDTEEGKQAVFKVDNLIIKPSSIEEGGTVSISVEVTNTGGISGSYNVTLKINHETKDIKTVILDPSENKTVSFDISASQQGTFAVDVNGFAGSYVVKKKGCIIATATYGSELSPEVQFLRNFRDNTVLNTFTGQQFMTVFNTVYYSFSPTIASIIAGNEVTRRVMQVMLYPLIKILQFGETVTSIFNFNPDLGIIVFCLLVSSLLSIVYLVPWVLLISYAKKSAGSAKTIRLAGCVLAGSLAVLLVAVGVRSPLVTMIGGVICVLAMTCLTIFFTMRSIPKRYIP
jgi:hypothetical protein